MIAVAGGKGGCGKTTTAACLARALSGRRSNPLLVDADLAMPNLHVVAGARSEPGLDEIAAGASIDHVVQSPVELPGVQLVASGNSSTIAVRTALARLQDAADTILVDTPAGASPAVADPLRVADATVIATTPTPQSLRDAVKTAAMARTLDTRVIGAVVTMSDGEVNPRRLLDCPTLAHVPTAEDPLGNSHVRDAYERAATAVNKRNV